MPPKRMLSAINRPPPPCRPAALLWRQHVLPAPKPPAIDQPDSGGGGGDDGNLGGAELEKGQSGERPCADLIAQAVDRGIDEALGLVAVLARQHREQHLAGRARDREIAG